MASSNVDLVHSIYEAWGRGDFSSAEWADPAIEFVLPDGVSPGSWTGVSEMSDAWREVLSAWTDFRAELVDCWALDEERVVVLTDNSGRGRTSSLEVGQLRTEGANLFHIRGGKVTKLIAYWDRDRAYADFGLDPAKSPAPNSLPE